MKLMPMKVKRGWVRGIWAGMLAMGTALETNAQHRLPVDYVNPFIGTEKSSHVTVWESRGATFPGVLLPFGQVQITPDDYVYSHTRIKSFSFLNHHSGWSSRGIFNLMPFTGSPPADGSAFTHKEEKATPFYYHVKLTDFGINAEFTATRHAALCRFTFPPSDSASFMLSDVSEVAVSGGQIKGRSGRYFFIALFSKPIQSSGPDWPLTEEQSPAVHPPPHYYFHFSTAGNEKILVRIGFSLISYAGAENNLSKELPGWDFQQAAGLAKKIWNDQLSRIEIETPDQRQKEIFYTALYHALFMPVILSDADSPKNSYGSLFPWDTYRSEHPLITLLDPDLEGDMISSELAVYNKTGWLPTGNMMGNHNTQLILDSYVKGVRNFDVSKACEAMCRSLLDSPYARREMAAFNRYGYVPANITSSVTHSLEFAYDDWAAAQFLEKTGNRESHQAAYDLLRSRAHNYVNSYDPADGFMEAKTADGQWTAGGYSEGNEWTYSWSAPQDVQGLINLMGGSKVFSNRLNQCFEEGHYVHDNEPPLHYAYLFNFSGQPWKTQQWARKITEDSYSADPGGLPGNDDLGALSSWYVFSAMGFYPATAGTAQYGIGSPLFNKTIIHLANGKQFIIKANQVSRKNKYIQSASLQGAVFNKSWFSHEDILSGKTLVLQMGPSPNKAWGNRKGSAPYSMTTGIPHFTLGKVSIDKKLLKADEQVGLSVWVKNETSVAGTVQFHLLLDGKPFQKLSAILQGGESKQLQALFSLYRQGDHRLTIPGLPPVELRVEKTTPAFQYRDLEIPMPPLVKEAERIHVGAKVKNTGSYPGETSVRLLVNGDKTQAQKIVLKPGEEKEISFSCIPGRAGAYHIGIGSLKPALVRVLELTEKPGYNDSLNKALGALLVLNFDEGESAAIPDHSGKGNNARVEGKISWVAGPYGLAVHTDASKGNYISFPDSSSLYQSAPGKELTLMAWIYPKDEKNFADIISKGDWNSLQLKGSNQMINFYADGWEGHEAMSAVPENWNRHWHHIAGVSNGTDYKLYVDGRLLETKKGEERNPRGETGMTNYSGMPWNIGRNAGSPDRVFNGYIDDVMIFDKALTQEQVQHLMLHIY